MSTIKFLEDRCITVKDGVKQVWLLCGYPQSKEYLSFKGKRYQLSTTGSNA